MKKVKIIFSYKRKLFKSHTSIILFQSSIRKKTNIPVLFNIYTLISIHACVISIHACTHTLAYLGEFICSTCVLVPVKVIRGYHFLWI